MYKRQVLLSKLSANHELKIDYYHDCRHDYEEFAGAFGVFTQPLPVPFYQLNSADLAGACEGFAQLLEEVQDNQEYIVATDELANQVCHAGFYWHQQVTAKQMISSQPVGCNPLQLDWLETEQDDGKITLFFDPSRYEVCLLYTSPSPRDA